MKFFSEIKNLLIGINIIISERLDTVESSFEICYENLPAKEALIELAKLAPSRDTLSITLINESGDRVTITNTQSIPVDLTIVTEGLTNEDNICIRIQINKTVEDSKFSVYDYTSFVEDLLARSITDIMSWFSKKLLKQKYLIFTVFDDNISFSTMTMAFDSGENTIFTPSIDRLQRVDTCKDTSCFYDMTTFEILPDDFIIQGVVPADNQIKVLFGKISTILSLAYISSTASIKNEQIFLQINGQRTTTCQLEFSDVSEGNKWQQIYSWIFVDGNSIDKMIIAHNVVSLYCKYDTLLNIDNNVFDAIKTNYKLYLRNNVNQYIDMKRDIAKFIQSIVSQVGDYTLVVLGKFKTNLFAIFGFLFTVVLTNIGGEKEWGYIFTSHTIYLFEIFILGSIIYLFICFFEAKYKLQKIEKSYNDLKSNYEDILSDAEIQDAFKEDNLFNDVKISVNRGVNCWSIAWGSLLVVGILIIEFLTTSGGLFEWICNRIT